MNEPKLQTASVRLRSAKLVELHEDRDVLLAHHEALLLEGDASIALVRAYAQACRWFVWKAEDEAVLGILLLQALEIRNLAVEPAFRGLGHDRAMLEALVAQLKSEGRTGECVTLGTGDAPSTRRFYKRCGFCEVGRIANYFPTHYDKPIVEDGRVLRDQVRFARVIE